MIYLDYSLVNPSSTGVPVPTIYEPQQASISKLTCNFVLSLSNYKNYLIFFIVFSIPPSYYIYSGVNPLISYYLIILFSPSSKSLIAKYTMFSGFRLFTFHSYPFN